MDVEQPERRRRTRWDEQDGPRSWLVALACFISHSLVCGIAFTVGIYYVVFLAEFEGSAGATALVGSLNFGTLCITGESNQTHFTLVMLCLKVYFLFNLILHFQVVCLQITFTE